MVQYHPEPWLRQIRPLQTAVIRLSHRHSTASALALSHLVDLPQRLQALADEAVDVAALGDRRAAEEAVPARVLAALRWPDAAGAAVLEAAALPVCRRQRTAAALAQLGAARFRLGPGPEAIQATQNALNIS